MEVELRQLIVTKCRAKGISIEHLAQVTDCSLTELKGYEQGLFILSTKKLSSLILALAITKDELKIAVGDDLATQLLNHRANDSA